MKFSTLAIHKGEINIGKIKPVITPIFQTTGFHLTNEVYEKFLKGKEREVWIYTRHNNPTRKAAEEKLAAIEKGEDALLFSSGMGAISSTLLTFLSPSDHIVSSKHIYGGSYNFLMELKNHFSIDVTFVNPDDPEGIIDATRPNTKIYFFESLSNPLLRPFIIEGAKKFAEKRGIKIIVDNTFLSPYNFNPLKKGADIVIHSATKYIGGHSDLLAGAVIGNKENIEKIWKRLILFGASPDPIQCFLIERSIKTLAVRMERHNKNALEIANFLNLHPKVEKVIYPFLKGYYNSDYAKKNYKGGGGVVTFKIKGGNEAGMGFMRELKIVKEAPSLGGVESLVSMPFNTSHYSLSQEERERLGIEEGTIRLSVGIEDVNDLIEDLELALSLV